MIPYHRDPKDRHRLVILVGTYELNIQQCKKTTRQAWVESFCIAYNMVVAVVMCTVFHIVVNCVLFYIIPLPYKKKKIITWYHSLKGQYYWSCCWLKEKALMKIYAPTLQCKNNHFPSEPRKHCQKAASQNILCSLKLPTPDSLLCQPCRPALCIFELYLSPGSSVLSPTEGLFNVMLRYNCRSPGTEGNQRRKRSWKLKVEVETQWTEEVQKQNQIEGDKW